VYWEGNRVKEGGEGEMGRVEAVGGSRREEEGGRSGGENRLEKERVGVEAGGGSGGQIYVGACRVWIDCR
jgi:hypothetical protein